MSTNSELERAIKDARETGNVSPHEAELLAAEIKRVRYDLHSRDLELDSAHQEVETLRGERDTYDQCSTYWYREYFQVQALPVPKCSDADAERLSVSIGKLQAQLVALRAIDQSWRDGHAVQEDRHKREVETLRGLMSDLVERADRARGILSKNPKNWNMLDTTMARKALIKESEGDDGK